MAQVKSSESGKSSPISSPSTPRLFGNSVPRVQLEVALEIMPTKFLEPAAAVSVMDIPLKSQTEKVDLESTYISQLTDGRVIYFYKDGDIGLYTNHDCHYPTELFPALPAGITTFMAELPHQRILVRQKKADVFLLDLNTRTALKLDLSGQKVKTALAIDDQTVFLGTKDGKLIHWHLDRNELLHCWTVSIPERDDSSSENSYCPDIQTQADVNHDIDSAVPILHLAKNFDGQLFIILKFEDGLITGLFDYQKSLFTRLKFFEITNGDLCNYTIMRIFHTRNGDISLLTKSKVCKSITTVFVITDEGVQSNILSCKNSQYIDQEAFVLPNGQLVISCYKTTKPILTCVLEIQDFGFCKQSQHQLVNN